jgi:hypothetical protein
MAGALQAGERHHLEKAAYVQAIGSGIESDVAGDPALPKMLPDALTMAVDQAAGGHVIEKIDGFRHAVLFLDFPEVVVVDRLFRT